ncbi:flavoprotein [Mollicutes bacterium LVI A0039]|nr:flavoprotein [Mollicutes bacterium LVI A0039]
MKKKILLAVCGSVAAHKTTMLVEELTVEYDVQVVMTKSASKFVSPLTLEILSKKNVHIDVFDSFDHRITHVQDALDADVIVVAPASANSIAKIAHGIADNMLTAMLLVANPNKVLICPAMNDNMYTNKRFQSNLQVLKADGYTEVPPVECMLASGEMGIGGLAPNNHIITRVEEKLQQR